MHTTEASTYRVQAIVQQGLAVSPLESNWARRCYTAAPHACSGWITALQVQTCRLACCSARLGQEAQTRKSLGNTLLFRTWWLRSMRLQKQMPLDFAKIVLTICLCMCWDAYDACQLNIPRVQIRELLVLDCICSAVHDLVVALCALADDEAHLLTYLARHTMQLPSRGCHQVPAINDWLPSDSCDYVANTKQWLSKVCYHLAVNKCIPYEVPALNCAWGHVANDPLVNIRQTRWLKSNRPGGQHQTDPEANIKQTQWLMSSNGRQGAAIIWLSYVPGTNWPKSSIPSG
eukprot:1156350-Pelagomonas_calceolata.AAC.17